MVALTRKLKIMQYSQAVDDLQIDLNLTCCIGSLIKYILAELLIMCTVEVSIPKL